MPYVFTKFEHNFLIKLKKMIVNIFIYIFYLCVDILVWLAKLTGTTYELINIAIFVVGYPVFVLILFSIIYWQYKKIRSLNKRL